MAGQQVDIQCWRNSTVVYSTLCYIVCYTVHNPLLQTGEGGPPRAGDAPQVGGQQRRTVLRLLPNHTWGTVSSVLYIALWFSPGWARGAVLPGAPPGGHRAATRTHTALYCTGAE